MTELTELLGRHWPDMVAGCECMPIDDETGIKETLPGSWEAHLASLVEAIIDARLAPIRALADEWERAGFEIEPDQLRAALDAASAPVSAQQDQDGTQGQP